MALQYKTAPDATVVDPISLTEVEHKDSCDINLMYKNIQRGLQVRGGPQPQFGNDDLTISGLDFRIEKQRLEQELGELAHNQEFEESIFKSIPLKIREHFGFKLKKIQNPTPKNDDSNDETPKLIKTPPAEPKS